MEILKKIKKKEAAKCQTGIVTSQPIILPLTVPNIRSQQSQVHKLQPITETIKMTITDFDKKMIKI